MSRWVFGFRTVGERPITETERIALRRRENRLRVRRVGLAVLAVTAFLGAFLFLALAAGGPAAWWVGTIPCVALGCWLLSRASVAEWLALLHRRALRVGAVERYERAEGSPVRRRWSAIPPETDEEGHVDDRPLGEFWQQEERFEEALARTAGGYANAFETVAGDGAVIWVEGRPMRELVTPLIWTAPDDEK